MSSRIAILLTLFLFSKADNSSLNSDILYCCSKGSLNVTEVHDDTFCPNGVRYNINCRGQSIYVVDFDKLGEILELHEYCYVGEFTSQTNNATLVYSAAICEEAMHYPVFYFLIPISLVFLITTFFIYYNIKSLRTPEDVAFIVAIVCLGTFMLIQVMHHWLDHFGYELYNLFSFLDLYIGPFAIVAYFAWLNVIMVNQLRKNK